MYKIYTEWSQLKKVPRLSKEQLGRNLAKYTNYMIAKGGKERVWENVGIRDKYATLCFQYLSQETQIEEVDTLDTFL